MRPERCGKRNGQGLQLGRLVNPGWVASFQFSKPPWSGWFAILLALRASWSIERLFLSRVEVSDINLTNPARNPPTTPAACSIQPILLIRNREGIGHVLRAHVQQADSSSPPSHGRVTFCRKDESDVSMRRMHCPHESLVAVLVVDDRPAWRTRGAQHSTAPSASCKHNSACNLCLL